MSGVFRRHVIKIYHNPCGKLNDSTQKLPTRETIQCSYNPIPPMPEETAQFWRHTKMGPEKVKPIQCQTKVASGYVPGVIRHNHGKSSF